tara:strand:+ start:2617 stop:3126 length:510 start_codon:yes stop_codon:yes gene_type:complete
LSELINYIYIGSNKRLNKLKLFKAEDFERITRLNFSNEKQIEHLLDSKIADFHGNIVVILLPGCIPNKDARLILKKIALINQLSWGWFDGSQKFVNMISEIKKISTYMTKSPNLEQGIFFSRELYFSLGGFGELKNFSFKEFSKRLYSRLDPQKPLPPLIIRAKKVQVS